MGAREDDLVDFDLDQVAAQLRVGASTGEDFLGHRAGGSPARARMRVVLLLFGIECAGARRATASSLTARER